MVTEEEARLLPAKNLVTKAVGAANDLDPEVHVHDIEPGDLYLMCSDGLTEMVTPHEIGGMLNACGTDIREAARRLIDLANEAGGRDNTSVIVIRIAGVPRYAPPEPELVGTTIIMDEPASAEAAPDASPNDGAALATLESGLVGP